ncbi:hypothetical protein [Lentibacter sp.]|uniref:hypothetical protein n=1 Tax=Lentibacter sp. TaxID=2024994 RepID=UPI003F6AFF56
MLVTVGELGFALPPTYEAMLRLETRDPEEQRQVYYSRHRDQKSDLRHLCNLSDGGSETIIATELWTAKNGSIKSTGALLGNPKIMILRDSHFTREMYGGAHFDVHNLAKIADLEGAITRGDADNGALCRDRTTTRYCTIWKRLSPTVRIKATLEPLDAHSDADALARLNRTIDDFLA